MRHERRRPESFAELVQRVTAESAIETPDVEVWPQPIRDGKWTDGNGTHWHIRGGPTKLPHRVLRRLRKYPELRVLHAYGAHPTEVSGPERDLLFGRVERFLAGAAPPHSEFWLAEFRDDERHVMLVIEEAC